MGEVNERFSINVTQLIPDAWYSVTAYSSPLPTVNIPGWDPTAPITILYACNPVEPKDLTTVAEAEIVAEIVRRVLADTISDRAKELLQLVISRCEKKSGEK